MILFDQWKYLVDRGLAVLQSSGLAVYYWGDFR